jgi:hypothetical protein
VGTAFSVLIRLELSGPGVQFIADNQLYNSIITAHAIIMLFFIIVPAFIGSFCSFIIPLGLGGPTMGLSSHTNISYFSLLPASILSLNSLNDIRLKAVRTIDIDYVPVDDASFIGIAIGIAILGSTSLLYNTLKRGRRDRRATVINLHGGMLKNRHKKLNPFIIDLNDHTGHNLMSLYARNSNVQPLWINYLGQRVFALRSYEVITISEYDARNRRIIGDIIRNINYRPC